MSARWIAAVIVVGGCGDCGEAPPVVQPPRDAGLADFASEPAAEELVELWKGALKDQTVAPGEPAALRYAKAPCALEYELRAIHLNEVAPGREPAGMELIAKLAANPDGDRLTWQLTDIQMWMLNDGMRGARQVDKGTWSPALVRTDGAEWSEVQGPTTLWSTHSTLPPLHRFFPRLPDPAVGSTTKWTMVTHAPRSAAMIEKRRAEDPDAAVPNLRGDALEVEVTLTEWIRVADVSAAVLVTSWTDHVTQVEPIESERAEKWRGRFVVASGGWLVHAALLAGKYQWWATSEEEYNATQGSSELELRLVSGCQGGPSLARFPREQ